MWLQCTKPLYVSPLRVPNLLIDSVTFADFPDSVWWVAVQAQLIQTEDIIIDAKSGVSGAGRSAKQNLLYTEIAEGINSYGVTKHRHMPEIEQVSRHFWNKVCLQADSCHVVRLDVLGNVVLNNNHDWTLLMQCSHHVAYCYYH